MDYSQFLYMKEELSLIAVILILFVVDLFTCPDQKGATPKVNVRSLTLPAVILMTLHTVINLFPGTPAEAFGGMYQYTPMQTIIKAVLNVGTRHPHQAGRVLCTDTLYPAGYVLYDFCGTFPDVLHRIGNGKYPDGRTGGIR